MIEDVDFNFQFLNAALSKTNANLIHIDNGEDASGICGGPPRDRP
jgi:hypothetical protein